MLCVGGSAIRPSHAAASRQRHGVRSDNESELVLNFNALQTAAVCYLLDQRGLRRSGRTNTVAPRVNVNRFTGAPLLFLRLRVPKI